MRFLLFILLFILLLFAPVVVRAASGDIIGAWTATNGSILYVNVTNVSTNGTWSSFGLGTENRWTGRENVKVKLTVIGNGFSESGAVQTSKGRTLIGQTKFPGLYPATNSFETSADGTVATLQIAMSDFVFLGETISLDMSAGLYAESSKTNLSVSGLSVTNNSYINYTNARPVFSWITPQFVRSTGATFRVEALACHWSSIYDNSGRPVQAIEMRASDQNSHSVTTILTTCFFDYNDFGASGARYLWDVPTATFNDTNTITVQARTLPFFGTNAIIDTSDGVYAAPNPNYCPLKFLNDPNDTYGQCYANVNKTSGDDATGVVTNLANWTTNVAPFYTIRGAAFAICKYNSNFFGRMDCGGGHINLAAGGWRMAETNLGAGVRMPRTYVELLPYPGLARGDCYLYSNHLDTDISGVIKCSGMTFKGEAVGTAVIFSIVGCLWTDDCDWATGQSAPLNIVTNWYSTRDRFYKMTGSLKMAFGASGGPVFVRDALFNFTNTTSCLTPVRFRCLKNNVVGGANVTFRNAQASATPARASTIWAYNQTYALTNAAGTDAWTIERDVIDGVYIGEAFLCNVVEPIGATPLAIIAMGTGGGTSNMPNVMVFNNTVLNKVNWFYDEGLTVTPMFYSPSWVVGNYIDDANAKGDEFNPPSGARYGSRPQLFSIGFNQNILPETYNIGTPGNFQQGQALGFYGLNSFSTNATSTNTLFQFSNRKSYAVSVGSGNGNYRYLSPSPAFKFIGPRVLSHKLDGPTSAIDPPGAFTAGNVKKGAMF